MAKRKILIVEDERIVAEDILRTLRNCNYDVSSIVSSGKEAIKEAGGNKPDLVLMDIKLREDKDGVEVAEQIREQFGIPVIYVTALSDVITVQRAKITEPFGYIHKPVDEKELLSTIEIALYRHKMDMKLKESEEFNFALFQYSPIETIIVNTEGRVIRSNLAKRKSGDRLPNVGDVMFKDYAEKQEIDMYTELMECIRSGKKKRFPELKYSDRFLDIMIASFPKGAIITSQDITERKRAEKEKEKLQAQLMQSEKMAGIGTLASGMAHEFNNILQIMIGHVQLAQKTKTPEDTEEALAVVLDTSERASKIIKDLLVFSRPEEAQKELCDIAELLKSVLSLTRTQLRNQNIQVVRKYKKTPKIRMNKAEIEQVFLNMITNARDAMQPKGGKLEIGVKQVEDNVEVSFSDTGRGIEEEDLSKVFEPFYTTKGAVGGSTSIPGTGLGLSVSYGIVQRHDGTIEVESHVGQRTTFTVKLPASEKGSKKRSIKEHNKKERRLEL